MTKAEKAFRKFEFDVALLQNRETKVVDQVIVLGRKGDEVFNSEPITLGLPMRVLRKDGIDND